MELVAWLAMVLFQASKFEPPIYLSLGFVLSNLWTLDAGSLVAFGGEADFFVGVLFISFLGIAHRVDVSCALLPMVNYMCALN
jgi:hypothetical protein